MPSAIQVTKENIPDILVYAKLLQFNLDHLSDTLEDAASYGHNLYLITDGSESTNNVTFTTFWEVSFRGLWKFVRPESTTHFTEIEKA